MIEEVREILTKQGWDIVSKHEYMTVTAVRGVRGYNLLFTFIAIKGTYIGYVLFKDLDKNLPSKFYSKYIEPDKDSIEQELKRAEKVLRVFEQECGEGWDINQEELVELLKKEL